MNCPYTSRVRSLATRTTVLAGCLALAPLVALAQTPPKPRRPASSADNYKRRQDQAIRRVKDFRASRIDHNLPNVSFGLWLEHILGPGLSWEMNDCGEGAGPLCVEIDGKSPEVAIMLNIGSEKQGISGAPVLFFGTIKLFDVDRDVRGLPDLPALVQEARWRATVFRDRPLKSLSDADAIRVGKRVPVQALEPLLPAEPFEQWLTRLTPGATLTWSHHPCGGNGTEPSCVSVSAKWPNGSSAGVALNLEAVQRGLTDRPVFSEASLYRLTVGIDRFTTLVAFAAAIQAARF